GLNSCDVRIRISLSGTGDSGAVIFWLNIRVITRVVIVRVIIVGVVREVIPRIEARIQAYPGAVIEAPPVAIIKMGAATIPIMVRIGVLTRKDVIPGACDWRMRSLSCLAPA